MLQPGPRQAPSNARSSSHVAQRRQVWAPFPLTLFEAYVTVETDVGDAVSTRYLRKPARTALPPLFFHGNRPDGQGHPRDPPFLFLCLVGDHLRQVHPP